MATPMATPMATSTAAPTPTPVDRESAGLLARLPIELLLRITRHLSTTELCAVRLTCRTIERALFHAFSNEFFRRKQFMLTDFSLQALLDISHHPVLSRTLRHVSFGLEKFNTNLIYNFATLDQAIRFKTAAAQQHSLLYTGRGIDMLAEAFAGLPNIETVDIRDFDSRTRFRDGAHHPWASYGWKTITEQTGGLQGSMTNGGYASFSTDLFSLVLAALARAGVRPPNLEVLLRSRSRGVAEQAFDLTALTARDLGPLLAVVSGLRKLHVDLELHSKMNDIANRYRGQDRRGNPFQPVTVAGLAFHRFLAAAHNVEWLRVNLQNAHLAAGNAFLDFLARPLPGSSPSWSSSSSSSPSSFPSSSPLPRLRRLELGHAWVAPTSLLAAIERIPTLQALTFWNLTLQADANPDRPSTNWEWAAVFRRLALVSSLHEFSIGNVLECRRTDNAFSVQFDDAALSSKHADAATMKEYLETLARNTKVMVHDTIDYDEDDSMSEDGDEDENEDDNEDGDGDGDGDGNGGGGEEGQDD